MNLLHRALLLQGVILCYCKWMEEKLIYGYVSSPVKIGNTVHRQTGPWTPTVHALLSYLHNHGFKYSPTVEGIDEKNREILKYIPGEAAVRPWPQVILRGDGIQQAGRILRKYHEIVMNFVLSANAEWRIGKCELKPGQIIRHGDLGPWNTIWQDDTLTALIDWDFAQPGERIDDLAQMAYYFVPLRGENGWKEAGFSERPNMAERLRTLVESYGMFSSQEVIDALFKLLEHESELVSRLGTDSVEPWASFLKRGDVEESQRDVEWLKNVRQELLR